MSAIEVAAAQATPGPMKHPVQRLLLNPPDLAKVVDNSFAEAATKAP